MYSRYLHGLHRLLKPAPGSVYTHCSLFWPIPRGAMWPLKVSHPGYQHIFLLLLITDIKFMHFATEALVNPTALRAKVRLWFEGTFQPEHFMLMSELRCAVVMITFVTLCYRNILHDFINYKSYCIFFILIELQVPADLASSGTVTSYFEKPHLLVLCSNKVHICLNAGVECNYSPAYFISLITETVLIRCPKNCTRTCFSSQSS